MAERERQRDPDAVDALLLVSGGDEVIMIGPDVGADEITKINELAQRRADLRTMGVGGDRSVEVQVRQ